MTLEGVISPESSSSRSSALLPWAEYWILSFLQKMNFRPIIIQRIVLGPHKTKLATYHFQIICTQKKETTFIPWATIKLVSKFLFSERIQNRHREHYHSDFCEIIFTSASHHFCPLTCELWVCKEGCEHSWEYPAHSHCHTTRAHITLVLPFFNSMTDLWHGGMEGIRFFCFGHSPNMPFRSTLLICIPNIDFTIGTQHINSWGFFSSIARCVFGVDLFFEHDPTGTSDPNGSTWCHPEFLIAGPHLHVYSELNNIFILSTCPCCHDSINILELGDSLS